FRRVLFRSLNSCKKCIKLNDAWGATLNKTEVIKGLKTQGLPKKELAKLEKEMPDEVQYFVGNNKGNWEEYLQVSEKRFDRIAGAPIDNSKRSELVLRANNDTLLLNGVPIPSMKKMGTVSVIPTPHSLFLVCGACVVVHGRLGISFLNCICCFLGNRCAFPCPWTITHVNYYNN